MECPEWNLLKSQQRYDSSEIWVQKGFGSIVIHCLRHESIIPYFQSLVFLLSYVCQHSRNFWSLKNRKKYLFYPVFVGYFFRNRKGQKSNSIRIPNSLGFPSGTFFHLLINEVILLLFSSRLMTFFSNSRSEPFWKQNTI